MSVQGDLFAPRCKPTSDAQDCENAAAVMAFLAYARGWVSAAGLTVHA